MTTAQVVSLTFGIGLIFVLVSMRRLLFSWSPIGVFFLSHAALVCLGVLLFPWGRSIIEHWFPAYNLTVVTDTEVAKAIILTCGGVLITLATYLGSHWVFHGGSVRIVGRDFLRVEREGGSGLSGPRLWIACVLSLGFCGIVLVEYWPVLLEGVKEGFLGGNPAVVLDARRKMTENYLFVVLLYNVLPFLGAALWLRSRLSWNWRRGALALLFNVSVVMLLLSLFQKRPLVAYLLALILVELWLNSRRSHHRNYERKGIGGRGRVRRVTLVLSGAAVIFGGLMVLYYFHTTVGRSGEAAGATVLTLALIIFSRVVWRLALPVLMYAHYYPAVERHYGWSNIEKLSMVLDWQLYLDTKVVFEYFAAMEGTVASCALLDFYGGFGVFGWIVGAMLLGCFLERLEDWLGNRKANGANALLAIFLLIFVLYLSQASLARSLLGYGGIPFVLTWLGVRQYRTMRLPVRTWVVD